MRYVRGFLARLGFFAIILLALACSGFFDTGAPAVPAPVYQLSQPQLAAEAELDADDKAMKGALAAYKQASDETVKACLPVIDRSIEDCDKLCVLFDAEDEDIEKEVQEKLPTCKKLHWRGPRCENTRKRAVEETDRKMKMALEIASAPRDPTYAEVAARLSPLCVQEHLKECGVVEIMQSESLDEHAKAAAKLKLAAQIDPVCGAAVAFQAQKGQEFHDAADRAKRELDRGREVDRDTSCFPTPGGGGFNCYSY